VRGGWVAQRPRTNQPTPLTPAPSDALYLATRGGAGLLGREGELGVLEAGALADLLLVDMDGQQNTRLFGHETPEDMVHKMVFLGDDRNILEVFVAGNRVKGGQA